MKKSLSLTISTLLSAYAYANANAHANAHQFPDPNLNPGLLDSTLHLPLLLGYTLTWHDEFIGSSPSPDGQNQLPSPSDWLFDTGTSYPSGAANWGNNELQTYTTSPSNIHITPSNTLAITPRSDSGKWTSARVETTRSFLASPGGKLFIESRLRTGCAPTHQQKGIWPAFWALGESFRDDHTHWPMASEWDFVEVVNGEPRCYSTIHCGVDSNPGGYCNEYNGLGNGGVSWSGCEWHEVGFEVDRSSASSSSDDDTSDKDGEGDGGWKGEALRWFIDGVQVWEVVGSDVGDFRVWETIAHQGHFLLLDVAVGGNWPGYPDEETVDGEGVQMEVDYVRVWNLH